MLRRHIERREAQLEDELVLRQGVCVCVSVLSVIWAQLQVWFLLTLSGGSLYVCEMCVSFAFPRRLWPNPDETGSHQSVCACVRECDERQESRQRGPV